jgi:choline dehydrogenase-like flavoprotein
MRWIVVGAGAAGCAIASRLASRDDDHVLLLEAGPGQTAESKPGPGDIDLGDVDLGDVLVDAGPRPNHASFVRPNVAVVRRSGDMPTPYVQGRGLGGSSLINGGVVTGGVPADLAAILPLERPWSHGMVADALLAADDTATDVLLVRRDGIRVTAAEMFLDAFRSAATLTIRTDTEIRKLLMEDRRVVGVVTVTGEELLGDAVVLCAGAIETPALLLRSGVDTPGVGVGLQDRPSVRLVFDLDPGRFDPTVPAISVVAGRGGHQLLALDHVHHDLPLGVLMAGLLRVSSRGAVTLPDPEGPTLVHLNMLSARTDVLGLAAAAIDLVDIVNRPNFRQAVGSVYIDDHGTSLSALQTASDVERWAPAADLSGYYHVSASCRRGVVTDADGWVRGYERLAIADASLFDGGPVSDPYIAVVVQALRLPTQAFVSRYRS